MYIDPDKAWRQWLREQSPEDQLVIAENALAMLWDLGEVSFYDGPHGTKMYWVIVEEGVDVPF